jgi:predicted MPP superfamily phosphohydrolase
MLRQLLLMSAAFHALNLAALLFLARLWRHRCAEEPAIRPRVPQIVADLGILGTLAIASAAAFGLVAKADGFGVINLVSQWVFAEFLLLLTMATYWLRRFGARTASTCFAGAVVSLLVIFVDAHYIEPSSLEVKEHVIDLAPQHPRPTLVHLSPPRADRPVELRVAHLSDIQTALIGDHERRAFREATDLSPDLIVMTGDYLQALPGHEDLGPAREAFRQLLRALPRPRLGIYAVKGDVEGADWPSIFEGTPVIALTDEWVRIPLPGHDRRALSLLGISAGLARGRDRRALRRLVAQLPTEDLKIIIGHNPDFVMGLEPGTVHLALAGHTHGGQIALPFYGAPITLSRLPRRMARGVHVWNGTRFHVSAGVGMERELAPQVRFLCRPEVCLLRVKV